MSLMRVLDEKIFISDAARKNDNNLKQSVRLRFKHKVAYLCWAQRVDLV